MKIYPTKQYITAADWETVAIDVVAGRAVLRDSYGERVINIEKIKTLYADYRITNHPEDVGSNNMGISTYGIAEGDKCDWFYLIPFEQNFDEEAQP